MKSISHLCSSPSLGFWMLEAPWAQSSGHFFLLFRLSLVSVSLPMPCTGGSIYRVCASNPFLFPWPLLPELQTHVSFDLALRHQTDTSNKVKAEHMIFCLEIAPSLVFSTTENWLLSWGLILSHLQQSVNRALLAQLSKYIPDLTISHYPRRHFYLLPGFLLQHLIRILALSTPFPLGPQSLCLLW